MSEIVNSTYPTLDGVIEHPPTWPDMGGFGPARRPGTTLT